ncbi:tctex1 domain-containing protein 2 [Sarotherodon galilaeus]
MSQVRQVMQSPADTLGGDNAPPTVLQVSRLAAHFPQWHACAPSPWVLRTVAMGYRLQFRVKPPRFQRVVNMTVNTEAAMILREEIKALLQKRAIRVVPASEIDKSWYSRYFVVPKKGGGLRPILDLRVLNTYLRTYRFKMLTLRQLLNGVGLGDWFVTIDLTDAYFHVAIHPKHRQFLRFAFEGIAYEYLVLPFGLLLAPCTFTKCAEAALAPLRERGICILAYLDDWALVACSREQAETQLSLVLSHIQTLGFSVNFQKSSLIPSQQISFVGLEICSLSSRARLSEHRVAAFHRCLAQFQLGRRLRFQTILSLLGMMASMIAVVPLGPLKMRPFQRWTLSHHLCASRHLRRRLPVTASCMLALRPWREPRLLHQGSRIGRVLFRKVVSTDASLRGWGALCEGASVRGIWSTAQRQLHINHLELLAVFLALKHFRPVLEGQHVLVRTDNSTVVSYINRQGGTRSLPLLKLSRSLLLWCSVHFLSLRATHVPGHLNLGPDLLSRGGPLVREWRLHPLIVAQIWDLFGKAQIDLFASRVNTHCPLFFSIIDHDAPLGLDALAHQWPDVLLYAFPPVEMISPVLERVRRHSLSLILVAPWWPTRSWYAEIISLLAASPWQLPLRRDLLSQAGGEVFHPRPDLWRLHAYLLRG